MDPSTCQRFYPGYQVYWQATVFNGPFHVGKIRVRLHQSEIDVDDCGRGAVVLVGLQQRGLAASRVVGMTADVLAS